MLCEMCKKSEATVQYTEVVSNNIVKTNICEECAKKKGVALQASFKISDLLAGLADMSLRAEKDVKKVCPGCGLSYVDFRKMGRLGCDQCYSAFEESLQGLLESIHKSTRHAGKVPLRNRIDVDKMTIIKELEAELKAAIEREEFEKAARLRDRIYALKKERKTRKTGAKRNTVKKK